MLPGSKALRILERVALFPGETELQIARALYGATAVQQNVNGEIARLRAKGLIRRDDSVRPCRYYAYDLTASPPPASPPASSGAAGQALSEDEIKDILRSRLNEAGWTVVVKMGHERGIDIEARRATERWVIEVKGPGSRQPMRLNYFLAILGETLQRMDDPDSRCSIALPDLPQFRGLWSRLPALAKERTKIDALFVDPDGSIESVP